MHRRLEQLLQLHNMCTDELKQLQTNMEQYMKSSTKILAMIQNNWNEIERGNGLTLMIYDNFLTKITNVMNSSRKLNMQLILHQSKDDHEILITNGQQANNNTKQTCDTNLVNYSSTLKVLDLKDHSKTIFPIEESYTLPGDSEDFLYPQINVRDSYKLESVLRVFVTYIKNLNNLQFYVLDPQSKNVVNVYEVAQSLDLHQYHSLPPANEIFGLVSDKRILRAVRSTKVLYDQEKDEEIWPCYLLDFGEVVNLKLSDIKYKLTELQQKTPACAILCQMQLMDNQVEELKDLIKSLEYKECFIKIKDIEENKLIVELQKTKNPENIEENAKNSAINDNQKISNGNPTKSSPKKDKIYFKNKKQNTNPFLSSSSNETSPKNSGTNPFLTPTVKGKKLTSEEREMLYEEPLCTSNANKAVLGYDPKDDRRLCRFYDPTTGACFKGSNCKQEHIPFHPEGYTKDVLPTDSAVDNRTLQIVYPKGTLLNVTLTHIGQLGAFYCQINDNLHNNTTPLIWNDEDIPPWKRLETPPPLYELVLCRYEDGLWYRAKITSYDDSYRMFKVFYVDYGNQQLVNIKNLAKCDNVTSQIPFQAVLCRLAYLKENEISAEKRRKGIKMLCDLLLNKTVTVKVISHHEDLIVSLEGELNLTVKSRLVHGGYMKPF